MQCIRLAFVVVVAFGVFSCVTQTAHSAGRVNYLGVTGKSYLFPAPTRGLIGHWTFDERDMAPNVQDRSSQGNHGLLSGFSATTSVTGRLGNALSFNGSTDKVRIANSTALNGITSSQITVSAWVYVNADSLSTNKTIFSSWGGASTGYQLYLLTDGKVGAWSGSPGYTPGPAISFRQWHHVAMAYDGTNVTIYVDGDSQGSTAKTFTTSSLENQIGAECSGAQSTSCDQYFIGYIDDVRIYNRALAAGEMKALYLSRSGAQIQIGGTVTPTNLQSGLVGHWTFDGPDMIPNVRDKSGQGNHGTLSGYTSTTSVSGKVGQALSFRSAASNYVSVGSSASLNPSYMSVSAWIYLKSSGPWHIYSRDDGGGGNRSWQFRRDSNGKLNFTVFNSGSLAVSTSAATLPSDTWLFVTGTYDGTTIRTYINGAQDGSAALSGTIRTGSTDTRIGWVSDVADVYPWDGYLDDVREYNRALSAAEVLQLYNLGR